MKIDILVLNYNGKQLLERFLPSVIASAGNSKHECAVLLVDNLSSDGSTEFVRGKFPQVKVAVSTKNEVLCSYNDVIRGLDSDVVVLLNNDIETGKDFVDYLAEHFRDPDVAFVAPRILNLDNTFNGGKSYLEFRMGIIKNAVDFNNPETPGQTHSISTGAFRREDFLYFGGFDRLYLPGIWEEVDLCFRALRSGKKGIYEPRSIIWHQESTTFNREFGVKRKLALAHRNMFLFLWKNVRDANLLLQHCLLLLPRILFCFLSGKFEFVKGFLFALRRLPVVLRKRRQETSWVKNRALSDTEIIRCV